MVRIKDIKTMPNFLLQVSFDDGKTVIYDVKEDFGLPGYADLEAVPGLFDTVKVDQSRTCIYWSEDVDLPSDTLYEYGKTVTTQ